LCDGRTVCRRLGPDRVRPALPERDARALRAARPQGLHAQAPPRLMRPTILVAGGDVVTMNPARDVLVGGTVAIDGDRIVAVGSTSELRAAYPDADVFDASGCVVTPGMIDAHQHLTGDPLVRSCIPDLLPPGASIFEWSVPLHGAHTGDDDEASGLLSAVEARSEEHTSELQSRENLVCRLLLGKKNLDIDNYT